jgi:membrane associated rhomboid family serine protease
VLIPTRAEYLAARSYRSLTIFNSLIGALFALLFFAMLSDLRSGKSASGLRELLFLLVLFGSLFGLPMVALKKQRAKLMEQRKSGNVGGLASAAPVSEKRLQDVVHGKAAATLTLVVSIVLVYVISFFLPDLWLEQRFAKVNISISDGELWRLVTTMFLHAGLMHLFFNASSLLEFGRVVENLYGPPRFVALYFLAGAMGTIASFLATPVPSVGASGGIFGLMGVMMVFGLKHRTAIPEAMRRRFVREIAGCVALNILLGALLPNIDNAAHIGGLVAGLLLALVFAPKEQVLGSLKRLDGGGIA